jgi:DNA-binding LacI/PurR family transcriptional regulator
MNTANYKDNNSTEEDIANFNLLFEKRVDGIIYFPTNVMQDHIDTIKRIKKKIPIVITDKELKEVKLPCVIQDFVKPTKEVMRYLLQIGHKRIAFINGLSYDLPNNERYQIYQKELQSAGIAFDENLVEEAAYSVESGYYAMLNILENSKVPPTAVFAGNDHMAIGAIKALKEQGFKLPQDVAVVGYDDIEFAKYVSPSLTTIKVNQYTMGKMAATMVIDLIEGHLKDYHKMTMDYEFILRDSTKQST